MFDDPAGGADPFTDPVGSEAAELAFGEVIGSGVRDGSSAADLPDAGRVPAGVGSVGAGGDGIPFDAGWDGTGVVADWSPDDASGDGFGPPPGARSVGPAGRPMPSRSLGRADPVVGLDPPGGVDHPARADPRAGTDRRAGADRAAVLADLRRRLAEASGQPTPLGAPIPSVAPAPRLIGASAVRSTRRAGSPSAATSATSGVSAASGGPPASVGPPASAGVAASARSVEPAGSSAPAAPAVPVGSAGPPPTVRSGVSIGSLRSPGSSAPAGPAALTAPAGPSATAGSGVSAASVGVEPAMTPPATGRAADPSAQGTAPARTSSSPRTNRGVRPAAAPPPTLDLFALEAGPAEPASASPPSRPLPRPARAARTAGPTTTQPPLLQPLTSPPPARVVSHSPMSDAAVPSDVLGLFAHPAAPSTPAGRPVVVVSPRSFGSTASPVDPAHRDEASDPAGPAGRGAALLDLAGPGSAGPGRIGEQDADRGADPTRPTVVPVPEPLAVVLPRGGLPRGGVVSLAGQGATSLLFSLLAGSRVQWAALVGMPGIGLAAAAEFGIDLDRLVVIPDPGEDVLQVLSVLVDGVEVVAVAAPKAPPPAGRLRVLNGRLRQRGAVLLVAGPWPGADITLTATLQGWTGLHQGHGRLRDRELLVQARGRGAAAQGREAVVLLRSDRRSVRVVPAVAVPATGTTATGTSGEQEGPTAAMG